MRVRRCHRRGFALVLVLVFVTLILALWGVATRHTASMLRIEQARASRAKRDAARLPALTALAAGAAALEVGFPPTSPYVGTVLASDGEPYQVRFVADPDASGGWTVSVAPGWSDAPTLDAGAFRPRPPSPGS